MIVLAIGAAVFCLALTIRCYMPCPWTDEWGVVADLANGSRPWSWGWLWTQHSEHRIAILRLLIWLDCAAFGGRNISLFAEIHLILAAHVALICYVIERFSDSAKPTRRMLQGVFGFCLFHPYQAQNLTWAFQVSFLLPFAIGTAVLLVVTYFPRIPERWHRIVLVGIGFAPILAAMNLASGLLIGPAAASLACVRRLPRRITLTIASLSLLDVLVYAYGYQTPPNRPSPLGALTHPIDLVRYVLTALNTTWHFFSIAPLSLVFLVVCAIAAIRHREQISDFEWFCFAECGLALATVAVTACGRIHLGVTQAAEGRYQSVAVVYWAALFSLVLLAVQRWRPQSFGLWQLGVVLLAFSTMLFSPPLWREYARLSDANRSACNAVIHGRYSKSDVTQLDIFAPDATQIRGAAAFLRALWGK